MAANTYTSGRLQATFASLRYPNFRRWFIGQALSLMGTWMQSVAQGWLVYQLTGSQLALGTISFIGSIPTLFLMLPAGTIIDRTSKRRLVILTQTVMMICAFIQAAFAWTGILQVWHIGVLAFIMGVANSFDAPARQALAVDMVDDRRDMQNAIALNSTMFNLARVVGPAVGGLVLAGMGAAWCFALNGLSFVAVLIALIGMRLQNDTGKGMRTGRMMSEMTEGLRYVGREPVVRMLLLVVGISSTFGFAYSVLLPAYAADVLRVGEAGLGWMNAAVGIGALTGSLAVATLSRFPRKGVQVAFGSLIFPAALLVFSGLRSFPLALAFLVIVGIGFVTQNATSNTMVQTIVPDELRGRVMSTYAFMFFGTTPVSALFAGTVAQATSTRLAIALGAVISLGFAVFVFVRTPQVRRYNEVEYDLGLGKAVEGEPAQEMSG